MLEAERQAMKWEAYHSSLNILEREMQLVIDYLSNVGNQAALMAGFLFVCLTEEIVVPEDSNPAVECLFMMTVLLAMSAFIYSIVASTLLSVLGARPPPRRPPSARRRRPTTSPPRAGPTMGLKGKDGTSMRQAVEGMKHFRNNIMNAYYFGLLMFSVSAVWLVWFKLEHSYTAAVNTVIIIIASFCMLYNFSKMQRARRISMA